MSDSYGLDKQSRLAKKRSDAEEAAKTERERLNPTFPYRVAGFPYDFFGVDYLDVDPVDANTN